MKTRLRLMKLFWILPTICGIFRIMLTVICLFFNPFQMQFIAMQVIPLVILLSSLFSYLLLYRDTVPVITLLLPSIVQFILVLIFTRKVQILPYIVFCGLDFIYILIKSLKASLYPFEIENSSAQPDLDVFESDKE